MIKHPDVPTDVEPNIHGIGVFNFDDAVKKSSAKAKHTTLYLEGDTCLGPTFIEAILLHGCRTSQLQFEGRMQKWSEHA